MRDLVKMLACGAAFGALSACGGGGDQVAYIPPPPPAPPPPPPPSPPAEAADVRIFENPTTEQYAVASDLPPSEAFGIRYDATAKAYEVSGVNFDWAPLLPTDQANTYKIGSFQSWLYVDAAYTYSALGAWDYQRIAFGSATPAGQVPVSGSASYEGIIAGDSDTWDNGPFPSTNPVAGTIALSFDFGAGTLSGAIHPILYINDGSSPSSQDLGVLAFKDTVFSPGSTNFSGTFDTTVSGPNAFSGQFTGPNAEELIGTWALPFIWDRDQQPHWAEGAMIAKR